MPAELSRAYEVFLKLASPGEHYAYPGVTISTPAFTINNQTRGSTISPCVEMRRDSEVTDILNSVGDEDSLRTLLRVSKGLVLSR